MATKFHNLVSTGAMIALFFILKFQRKGVYDMQDLYVGLVCAQRRTCNPENKKVRQVPKIWREAVLEDLAALGLDADGYPVEPQA